MTLMVKIGIINHPTKKNKVYLQVLMVLEEIWYTWIFEMRTSIENRIKRISIEPKKVTHFFQSPHFHRTMVWELNIRITGYQTQTADFLHF